MTSAGSVQLTVLELCLHDISCMILAYAYSAVSISNTFNSSYERNHNSALQYG
jgi:hypothetical protein